MTWSYQRESKLGRCRGNLGREIVGHKSTFEILGEADADGYRPFIAKGLTEEDAKSIIAKDARIAALEAALATAEEES